MIGVVQGEEREGRRRTWHDEWIDLRHLCCSDDSEVSANSSQ